MSEAAAPQQETVPSQPQAPAIDPNTLYKSAYDRGEAQANKGFEAWLKTTFNTIDRAEIEKTLKQPTIEKDSKLPQSVLDQIAGLQKENESLKGQISSANLSASLQREVAGSGFSLHNASVALRLLSEEFDFKELNGELVAHRKGSDQPVVVDNRFANVKTLLGGWSKDPAFSFLFQTGQRVTMPQGTVSGRMEQVKSGELSNPDFVAALKRSGQFFEAMRNEPIDREKVELFMPNRKKN